MALYVLVADEEPARAAALARLVEAAGHVAELAAAAELRALERKRFPDVALVDAALADEAGELGASVVLVHDAADAETAASRDAADLLARPVGAAALAACLARVRRLRAALAERDRLRASGAADAALVAASPTLARLVERVAGASAGSAATVLVTGERGAEAESLARAIHMSGAMSGALSGGTSGGTSGAMSGATSGERAAAPFVALPPAADAGELADGLVAADGGTLFLPALDELDDAAQAALARFLELRRARRGAGPERALDVRVVAATAADLAARAAAGAFSEDLLYRVNVLAVRVPPLRERRAEVAALVQALLDAEPGPRRRLHPDAAARLAARDWPGNARELVAVVAAAAARSASLELGAELFGADVPSGAADALPLGDRSLRAVERELIRRVLIESGGNRTRAARVLGIDRQTLYNKLRRSSDLGAEPV